MKKLLLSLFAAAALLASAPDVFSQPASGQAVGQTNIHQFGGTAVVTGTGAGGAGVPRVTTSTDSTIGVTSDVPGTGAANLGKAEDAAHTTGDTGVATFGVVNESAVQICGADGDYCPPTVDRYGAGLMRNDHPNRWSAGLDAIGATLTEIKAAPGASLSLYIQTVVAQSTTTTAGQFTLRFGTGTNCGTGTGNLLNNSATARNASPANTAASTVIQFIPPIKVTANNAVCLLGVATNTTSMTMTGFTAP